MNITYTSLHKGQKALLNRIRMSASDVRSYPRLDVFKACHLISFDSDLLDNEVIEMFLRTMPQATGRNMIFYRPFTDALSWDERWAISLIEAVTRADFDSVYFMISAVVKEKYRHEAMQIASSMRKISA